MKNDKRNIILEYLYNHKYNNKGNCGDIKPLMGTWTPSEIMHTLDSLKSLGLIKVLSKKHNFWNIDTMINGKTETTLENYQAFAYITIDGEKYFSESKLSELTIKNLEDSNKLLNKTIVRTLITTISGAIIGAIIGAAISLWTTKSQEKSQSKCLHPQHHRIHTHSNKFYNHLK